MQKATRLNNGISLFILVVLMLFAAGHGQAQGNSSLVKSIHKVLGDCTFHEVTEEMFATIAEDDRYRNVPEMADIRKIRYLILVECNEEKKDFYQEFLSGTDLKDFSVLIRSKSKTEQFTFFRKKRAGDMYEYLLLHDDGLSYIVTSLQISTLNELSAVMQLGGSVSGG